ncbi:MAG TPA: glucose-6-phosphate dehydrogenase assembly protein OpcA [Acidimicrobiales bacterium]|nr:glucose-6-phosphate dehydrogenase assembly protein OpcA [Acidimicrobiales bacterium]
MTVLPAPALEWASGATTMTEVLAAADRLRLEGDRTAARATVVNLLVVTRSPEATTAAEWALADMGGHHPGRVILVEVDPGRGDTMAAEVQVRRAEADGHCVWWDTVCLHVGQRAADHLDAFVEPLLLHDLHVAAWYPDGVPEAAAVPAAVEQLIVEPRVAPAPPPPGTGDVRGTAAALTELARHRLVTDLAWLRVLPWRSALARLFDDQGTAALLGRPLEVRVRVAGEPWPAALLASWAAAAVGAGHPSLAPAEHLRLELDLGQDQVVVEKSGDGRVTARVRGAVATASLGGDLLVAALERHQRDRAYEEAVARVAAGAALT